MEKSLQGLVFEKILDELQTRITWVKFGDCRNIVAQNIVPAYRQYEEQDGRWNSPSVLVTPPPRKGIGGPHNNRDTVTYPFLIQVIDNDFNRTDSDRLRTWMKWEEQIRSYFSHGNLRGMAGVDHTTIDQRWLSRKLFRVYKNAVVALVLAVDCWETHAGRG